MAAPTRLIFYTSSWSAVSSMALGSQCGCIASVIAPTLASFLVMGQGLGMSLGPFAGSLLYKVGFGNAILNGFTSPAWVMAVVWCIFWVCVRLFYVDIPKDAHHWGQIGQSTTSSAPKVLGALLSDSIMLEEKMTTPRPASTSSDTHSPTSNLSFLHKLLPMGRPRLYVLVRHDLFLHPRSLGIQSSRIRRIQTHSTGHPPPQGTSSRSVASLPSHFSCSTYFSLGVSRTVSYSLQDHASVSPLFSFSYLSYGQGKSTMEVYSCVGGLQL